MVNSSIKRFYKNVTAVPDQNGAGFRVHLDGRAVKTPAKAEFVLPNQALADQIAAEWDAQGEHIVPATMPHMQLAATAIDRVAPNRATVIAELTGYGRSDLLCYRAQYPDDLVGRQNEQWQPLLDWAAGEFSIVLKVTQGVMPVVQEDAALLAIQDIIEPLDDHELAALHTLITVSGSVVIGLAVFHGRLDPAQAFDISQIDESYAIENWGEDAEATARRERLRHELLSAGAFLDLLRQ
ncbi:ATP12 family chaperone protein [Thalassospira marina]|uniref:ATP12 family chaperone protein n=1 Tax=Thalassospira marina TaxID=2048283 RepID=UPI00157FA8FE|nr:ATP12 family protein [Thalassospira marina]